MTSGVGARIRSRREWIGITQAELVRRTGMSKGYLSELESGRSDTPSGKVLLRLADALAVTVDWLLREEVEGGN